MNRHPPVRTRPRLSALALGAALCAPAALPGFARAAPETAAPTATVLIPDTEAAQRCEVPPELTQYEEALPGAARQLRSPGGSRTIVVLGPLQSGARDSSGAIAYPARLQARLMSELADVLPSPTASPAPTNSPSPTASPAPAAAPKSLSVETIGRSRGSVGDLSALIAKQVLPLNPALVIWQIGRADARRGQTTHRFGQELRFGLDALQHQGIDTVLMDIQYHPQFEALYRTDDYRQYLRRLAGMRNLPLLARYQMIEYWVSNGVIDLDSADGKVQRQSFEFIQDCIAFQLSRLIAAGIRAVPASAPR